MSMQTIHRIVLLALSTAACTAEQAGPRDVQPDPPAPRNGTTQVGRLTSVGNGEVRQWFDYDALGRVVQSWWRFDGTTWVASATYGYPARPATDGEAGTVLAAEALPHRPDAGAEEVLYDHDLAGVQRRISARRPTGAIEPIVHARRTDALGRTTAIVYGTCIADDGCDDGDDGRVVTTHTHDPSTLRLASVVTTRNEEVLQSLGYTFDPTGNLEQIDDARADHGARLQYDSLDRLTRMDSGGIALTYAYDAIGNLVRKDRAEDGQAVRVDQTYGGDGRGPHAIASAGAATYAYDENGNLAATEGRRDGDLEIAYNADNMPVAVHGDDGTLYRKHFLGTGLWKKVEGDRTTWYLPGTRIVQSAAGEEIRHDYGSWAERDGDGALHLHVTDHLGSASLVVDARGEVEQRASYWAWGEDRHEADGTFQSIHGYNFREKETSTGDRDGDGRGDFLYDYGARLYLPEVGRFASPDPFTVDGPNRYAYVRNNPLAYTDPSGYVSCPVGQDCGQDPPASDPEPPAEPIRIDTNVDAQTGRVLEDHEIVGRPRYGTLEYWAQRAVGGDCLLPTAIGCGGGPLAGARQRIETMVRREVQRAISHVPHYGTVSATFGGMTYGVAINTRNGDVFGFQGGTAFTLVGASVAGGVLVAPLPGNHGPLDQQVSSYLDGAAYGLSGNVASLSALSPIRAPIDVTAGGGLNGSGLAVEGGLGIGVGTSVSYSQTNATKIGNLYRFLHRKWTDATRGR